MINSLGKIVLFGLLPLTLASCSTTTPQTTRSNLEIFHVGEVEVRLYSDRDHLVRSLPPIFALLAATRVGDSQIQVSGYYDKENKRIYAINDARTVIHEFKHYLEPGWRHGAESAHDHKPQTSTSTRALAMPGASPAAHTAILDVAVEARSEF